MKRKPSKKPKSGAWFIKVRGSYLPNSWQGWLTYLPYVYFLIASLVYVYNRQTGFGDVSIGVVPYWLSAVVIMSWVAARKS